MTDILIDLDVIDDLRWYKIQINNKWYAVKACCRKCATRYIQVWTSENPYEDIHTIQYPDWLLPIRE